MKRGLCVILVTVLACVSTAQARTREWVDYAQWYTVQLQVGFSSDPNIQAHSYTAWGVKPGGVGGIPQGTVVAPGVAYSSAFLVGSTGIYLVSDLNSDHLITAVPVWVRVIRQDGKEVCKFTEENWTFLRSRVDAYCLDQL